MPRIIPTGFSFWPEQHRELDIRAAYESGMVGAWKDPDAENELRETAIATGGYASVGDAASANGWAGSGAGKLVLPFLCVTKLWPKAFPGDAQTVGSCVSHGTKNGILISLACEIVAGKPDETTGQIEGVPDVPPEGEASGVLNPAPIYWQRGYNGHGWSCPTAANVVVKTAGCVVARKYDDLGVDLTNVNRSIETMYGARKPPEAWQAEFAKHRIRTAADVDAFEPLRDALANGYGISSCGSEGFSSTRNEDGVSNRRGSWAHAMAYIGADDRSEIKQKYGEPLVLVQNSWGPWNSGSRRILGTTIDIPIGSFWARWSDIKRRYMVAFSGVAGWPARKLPTYGMGIWG